MRRWIRRRLHLVSRLNVASDDLVVLDASAVLAFARAEPGAERVRSVLHSAAINAVNAAECLTVLARFTSSREVVTRLARLGLRVIACDWDVARSAAEIHSGTRDRGLSLGDCICLATARHLNAPAITADRGWRTLDVGVRIEMLR